MWRSMLNPTRIVRRPMKTTAKVQHLEGTDFQKTRGFSPAVITEGGKTVWLAGQTTVTDLDGKDISGKFDEQAHHLRPPQPHPRARRRLARQPGDHDRLHQRRPLRRPLRCDPA